MNWLKNKIRAWLGLDTLPSIEMFKAMEKAQRERHAEIVTKLNAIDKRFENSRPIQLDASRVDVIDWEAFQQRALAQLEKENAEDRRKEN